MANPTDTPRPTGASDAERVLEPEQCSEVLQSLSAEKREAWHGFMKTHAMVKKALEADLIANFGMQMSSFDVLAQIHWAGEEGIRISDLAAETLLSQSRVSRLVTQMEGDGLARREQCDSDTRVVYAMITEQGSELVERVRARHAAEIDRLFFSGLTRKQVDELAKLWPRVLASIDAG